MVHYDEYCVSNVEGPIATNQYSSSVNVDTSTSEFCNDVSSDDSFLIVKLNSVTYCSSSLIQPETSEVLELNQENISQDFGANSELISLLKEISRKNELSEKREDSVRNIELNQANEPANDSAVSLSPVTEAARTDEPATARSDKPEAASDGLRNISINPQPNILVNDPVIASSLNRLVLEDQRDTTYLTSTNDPRRRVATLQEQCIKKALAGLSIVVWSWKESGINGGKGCYQKDCFINEFRANVPAHIRRLLQVFFLE